MDKPRITYIIATYRRPFVLRTTLRALLLQTNPNWEAVVVGDCCDEGTLSVIREINDSRIRYYNLPDRYGEQGGPNSIGMAVADGSWVAFLNHDDLLLPDHTQRVFDIAEHEQVDVVGSRFVSVKSLWHIEPARIDADFGPLFPAARSTRELLARPSYILEPASAWAIRRQTALAVGPWKRWSTVHRVPWHDWMLRVLKTGAHWRFDSTVTGICMLTHHRSDGHLYNSPSEAHEHLLHIIQSTPVEELRQLFIDSGAHDSVTAVSSNLRLKAEHLLGLGLLRITGMDPVVIWRKLRRHNPRESAQSALLARTGETKLGEVILSDYLKDPESLRVV